MTDVRSRSGAWVTAVTIGSLAMLAVIAVCRMESSSADFDPQYIRVLVERTMRFGGSYYVNGIHNKGPLEPIVYELAGRVGGRDGFWFVIAIFAMLAALCVGLAAAVMAVKAQAPRVVAVCVAVATVVHLTLSEADYAGVLYARNMTVALLCVAFVVATVDRAWTTRRRSVVASIVVGAALGLAVQTLLTATFTVIPILVWAIWLRRRTDVARLPVWALIPLSTLLMFAIAPLWYRVFGPWDEFRDGWWVYARQMSEGTGRNIGSQLSLGWDQFLDYYRERPELVAVVLAWIVMTAVRWRSIDGYQRGLRLLAAAWFVAAWFELIASQRYSSHYFSVLAVPTLMILAVLVADLTRRLRGLDRRRNAIALVVVTALVTIQIGGTAPFGVGIETAAAVSRVSDFDARRRAGVDGRTQLVEASLDLVSSERDPLLAWTPYPWVYLNLRRVSATRYIWKSFLMGEIYLGNSGPEYVLDGTWEHFLDDVDTTDPAAFYVEHDTPVAAGTPFASVVDDRFQTMFDDDEVELAFRDDLATWLLHPVDGSRATQDMTRPDAGCVRIDGTFSPSAEQSLRLDFAPASLPGDGQVTGVSTIELSQTADDTIEVVSRPAHRAAFVVDVAFGSEPIEFTLAIGARSAVLIVGAQIVAAVALDDEAELQSVAGAAEWAVSNLRTSPMPAWSGCD